eukprot:2886653-Amphidinium_carterae.1
MEWDGTRKGMCDKKYAECYTVCQRLPSMVLLCMCHEGFEPCAVCFFAETLTEFFVPSGVLARIASMIACGSGA